MWRQGSKVPVNVYDGDRPVCQCHSVDDARLIIESVNMLAWMRQHSPGTMRLFESTYRADPEKP